MVNTDLTEISPIERRVDSALMVEADGGKHMIVIESQTRPDESRRFSWPYYVSYLHNRYECEVTLCVVTADEKTARWARNPIEVGLAESPTQVTTPLVLAPDNVPVIVDQETAQRDVKMTMFSALTHRNGPHVDDIMDTLNAVLGKLDSGTAAYLAEFTEVGLAESVAAIKWRKLMTVMDYPYKSQLHREWNAEGEAIGELKGEANAVLRVLAARGLAVSEEIERRVLECQDKAQLDMLITRAVSVERAEDLFA